MCHCVYKICYKCFCSREVVYMCKGGSGGMSITKHPYEFWHTHTEWYLTIPTGSIKFLFCSQCADTYERMNNYEVVDVRHDALMVMQNYKKLVELGMSNLELQKTKDGSVIHYDTEDRPEDMITYVQTSVSPSARRDPALSAVPNE